MNRRCPLAGLPVDRRRDDGARGSSRRQFLARALAGAAVLGGFARRSVLAAAEEAGGAASAAEILKKLPPLEVGGGAADWAARAATAPVAIERCRSYDVKAMGEALGSLFDKIGGLDRLLGGKTVTVKLNTTGHGRERLKGKPAERTYQTHPAMVEAMCALFRRAGAKRIVLVESFYENKRPEEILGAQGWPIDRLRSAAEQVLTFEDTRHRGAFQDYVKLPVPWGGYVYPAYHLNRRYADTDILVSVAKLKNHVTAGTTGAVKNLFGMAPTSLYGNDAPNENTVENRGDNLHHGTRTAPAGVTAERYSSSEGRGAWDVAPKETVSYYRVPRVTADLYGARPVDLAIVEGVESCKGGEGPWCPATRPVAPGVILAGRNAVTVDAIATAVMGYDPLARAGEKPWYGDNHLELLARAGLGTNDPGRIEVAGLPLKEALFEYEPGLNGWIRRHA